MNLNKHLEFFDPLNTIKNDIHVIGCGAIGSHIAEMLTRMGVLKLHLWDFDIVSEHNITNQLYTAKDINHPKTEQLCKHLLQINPKIEITTHTKGWKPNSRLSGYVFLCVDNIDLRREIIEENKYNPNIKAMFDFRMRLTDAQHYAADWTNQNSIKKLLDTMQFTHKEAKETTPINACGSTLNIISTVRSITALGLANFINFVKEGKLKHLILIDSFNYILDAF